MKITLVLLMFLAIGIMTAVAQTDGGVRYDTLCKIDGNNITVTLIPRDAPKFSIKNNTGKMFGDEEIKLLIGGKKVTKIAYDSYGAGLKNFWPLKILVVHPDTTYQLKKLKNWEIVSVENGNAYNESSLANYLIFFLWIVIPLLALLLLMISYKLPLTRFLPFYVTILLTNAIIIYFGAGVLGLGWGAIFLLIGVILSFLCFLGHRDTASPKSWSTAAAIAVLATSCSGFFTLVMVSKPNPGVQQAWYYLYFLGGACLASLALLIMRKRTEVIVQKIISTPKNIKVIK